MALGPAKSKDFAIVAHKHDPMGRVDGRGTKVTFMNPHGVGRRWLRKEGWAGAVEQELVVVWWRRREGRFSRNEKGVDELVKFLWTNEFHQYSPSLKYYDPYFCLIKYFKLEVCAENS